MRIQFFIYLCAALYNVAVVSESLIPGKSSTVASDSNVHVALTASTLDCVPTCWENSRYVSACRNDITCLCDDTEYQIVSPALVDGLEHV